jgi:hypothetical protein
LSRFPLALNVIADGLSGRKRTINFRLNVIAGMVTGASEIQIERGDSIEQEF